MNKNKNNVFKPNKKRVIREVKLSQEEALQMGVHIWDEISKGIAQKIPTHLIPVVNEIFHKGHPLDAEVEFLSTEYIRPVPEKGHPYALILSDITFRIDGREIYHLEFQINDDNTISIRMLEYDFQIGLQHGTSLDRDTRTLDVQFPHSAVIYPTGSDSLPDSLECRLRFQDGTEHSYQMPVVKISDYELSELFRKHLYMFLPFSLLRFRSRLEALTRRMEKNKAEGEIEEERLKKELTAFLEELILGLETEFNQGMISERQYREYLRLVDTVVKRVLHGHPGIRKEADRVTECRLEFYSDVVDERDALKVELAEIKTEMSEKMADKDAEIADRDAEIARLKKELESKK